jgi:hypothetical protein
MVPHGLTLGLGKDADLLLRRAVQNSSLRYHATYLAGDIGKPSLCVLGLPPQLSPVSLWHPVGRYSGRLKGTLSVGDPGSARR